MVKKRFNRMLSVTGLALLLASCSVKDPVQTASDYPEILKFEAPLTIYLNSDQAQIAWVRVSGDAQSVNLLIETMDDETVSTLEMTDTGLGQDLIADDGQYIASLDGAAFNNQTGAYNLIASVLDPSGLEVTERIDSIIVVGDAHNLQPMLGTPVVPEIVPSNRLNGFAVQVTAEDPQGLNDIEAVHFQIYAPLNPSSLYEGVLKDDGLSGDSLAGDGIYGIVEDLSDTLNAIGDHTIRFQARDLGGLVSVPRVATFRIIGVNTPPVLSGLFAPSQVSRQTQAPFKIAVNVTDEQGLSDVRMVYFNSVKPDGTEAEANPILLFDDGTQEHGDAEAGDGEYSRSIVITPANMLGVYTFTFYAEDHGGNVSAPLVHELRVVDGGSN